jgi:hypothetical protein
MAVPAALPVFEPEHNAPRQDDQRQVTPENEAVEIPRKNNKGTQERPRHRLREFHAFVTLGLRVTTAHPR